MKQESNKVKGLLRCKICKFETKRSIFLRRHLLKKHGWANQNNKTAGTPKSVKSDMSENYCSTSKSAKMQRAFGKSKSSVVSKALKKIREHKFSSGNKFKHQCHICHDKFVAKFFLARHTKVVHQIVRKQKQACLVELESLKSKFVNEQETPTSRILVKSFKSLMKKSCSRKLF